MKLTPWHLICLCIAVGVGCLAGWISKEKYPVVQPANESATVDGDSLPAQDAFKHAPAALPKGKGNEVPSHSVQPRKLSIPKPQPVAAFSTKEEPVPYTAIQTSATDISQPQPQPAALPLSFPNEGPAQPEEADLPAGTPENDIKTDVNLHPDFYGATRLYPESEPIAEAQEQLEQTDTNH